MNYKWGMLVSVMWIATVASAQQLAECKEVAAGVDKTGRAVLSKNVKHSTAGDNLQLSTEVAGCINNHSNELSKAEIEQLDWLSYTLDADVMSRMWNYLERHHLTDGFNAEDAAGKR